MAGIDWLKGFLKRHQEIGLTSLGRVMSFNKLHSCVDIFDLLKTEMDKHHFLS